MDTVSSAHDLEVLAGIDLDEFTDSLADGEYNIYQALEPSRKQIRLLRILPRPQASVGQPLECTLVNASLDDNIQFDALSYTWDTPKGLRHILLNGQRFSIRRNLFNAITTLRDTGAVSSYLWADAICINQNDLKERSSQVRLMKDIYQQAATVHIWLGQAVAGVPTLFSTAESVAADGDPRTMTTTEDGCRNALLSVALRRWWRRMWVFQEAHLATRATVHCGTASMEWERFIWAIVRLSKWLSSRNSQANCSADHALSAAIFDCRAFYSWKPQFRENELVIELLTRTAHCQAENPRDHLYGILGMLPDSLDLEPDYELPVKEVFQNAVLHFIKWSKTLDHLRSWGPHSVQTDWPSWVPDFQHRWTALYKAAFNACAGATCLADMRSPGELSVHVHIVQDISTVAEPASVRMRQTENEYESSAQLSLRSWRTMASAKDRDEKESVMLFWSTLVQEEPCITVRATGATWSHEWHHSAANLDKWIEGRPLSIDSSAVRKVVLTKLSRLVVTQDARLALAQHGYPQQGDKLAILAGSRHPFILRPALAEGELRYRIVAECYSKGLMYGEHILQASRARTWLQDPSRPSDSRVITFLASILTLYLDPDSRVYIGDLAAVQELLSQLSESLKGTSHNRDGRQTELLQYLVDMICDRKTVGGVRKNMSKFVQTVIEDGAQNEQYLLDFAAFTTHSFLQTMDVFDQVYDEQIPDASVENVEAQALREGLDDVGTLALILGSLLFEILLQFERIDSHGSDATKHAASLIQLRDQIDAVHEEVSGDMRPWEWLRALKWSAAKEVAAERNVDSLFHEAVLV